MKHHNLLQAPERKKTTAWCECIRSHWDLLVATHFFTAEVLTWSGLVTYKIRFFIQVGSRRVHIAGITPNPRKAWMIQIARNATMAEWGSLFPGQHMLHDRDSTFCSAFQQTVKAAGVAPSNFPHTVRI